MRWHMLLLLFLAVCPCADAAFYEWEDGQGTLHFTDDLDNVPARFRGKVKTTSPAPVRSGAAVPAEEKPAVSEATAAEMKVILYGDYDEEWWRSSFKTARRELRKAQGQLAIHREELAALHRERVHFQRARDRLAYAEKAEMVAKDEELVTTLQNNLDTLDAEASRSGVPFPWRE